MDSILIDIGAALWLGILTSISPCPLSTNIAAISYVGRKVGKPGSVLFSGLLYTLGRTVAYSAVAILVTRGLLSIPGVSMFLQQYMNLFIGPVVLIVGILILDIWKFWSNSGGVGARLQRRIDTMGIWGCRIHGACFRISILSGFSGVVFWGVNPPGNKKHYACVIVDTLWYWHCYSGDWLCASACVCRTLGWGSV